MTAMSAQQTLNSLSKKSCFELYRLSIWMNFAAAWPIIILGAFVLADVICGMTDASAAQSPLICFTFRSGETGSEPRPIASVPTG